jgi:hypothetical protein
MRTFFITLGCLVLLAGSAHAQCAESTLEARCTREAGGSCNSGKWTGGSRGKYIACVSAANQTRTTKDTQGRTVTQKLTGRYTDCIRDGRKLGHSADAVKRYCDSRNLR